MSAKNLDAHRRWRNVTVAFRVSEEESALINALVSMSGLTKQDYITRRLLDREVVVVPSSRVHRALREQMRMVYLELRRLRKASELSPELETTIATLTTIFAELDDSTQSEVEREDSLIENLT